MNCLRCGREIPADQVFCSECLEDMDRHPVKPGVVIQLPKREEEPFIRRPAKRVNIDPEMRLKQLRQRYHRLSVILALLILLSGGLGVLWGVQLERRRAAHQLGQNYSTTAATTVPENDVSRETSNDRR